MNNDNNPAGRLYSILTKARSQNQQSSIKKVWSVVFETPEDQIHKIYYYLTLLADLTEQAEKEVKLIPDIDHSLYLKPFPSIRNILKISNLDAEWRNFQGYLNEPVMLALQFCSE